MTEILAFLTGLIALVIPGFGAPSAPHWNGYVEADYVYASPASSGTVEALRVAEGQTVAVGDVLFTLNQGQYQALVGAAEARVTAAEANVQNLATGSREDEIEVIRATLQKAEADLGLARDVAARSAQLFEQGIIPKAQQDTDRAALASAEAQVKQLQAQLKVAELPARDAQQWQAEANLAAARADAEKARADLADRTVLAPVAGRVERIFFKQGEIAGAGTPVLSILPADALKVKFYVPEAERASFAIGDMVNVACDGCPAGLTATLSYFATDPQFTPPVIYSRDERSRLTFLAEAVLNDGASVPPGQPVTVTRPE